MENLKNTTGRNDLMKKTLLILLTLVLTLGISVPMVIPAIAAGSLSVVSDASVKIVGVYNKAGGPANYVNLTGSPLNAVLAAEPNPYETTYPSEPPENLNSTWDIGTGKYFQDTNPGADWIWETQRAEDPATVYALGSPLYDPDASSNGRVVVFQKTFTVSGSPQYATLHIAADNGYEVWLNGTHVAISDTAHGAWATSELYEASLNSQGWQAVQHYSGLGSLLVTGTNTLKIVAGNEYYHPSNPDFETNNKPCPPYVAGVRQQNPGALIFKLDIQTADPPVPELPAGALFGLGLVGLVGIGWFGYRRSRAGKI
jgi:hypothetical protein